jgi:hypothetical protein
VQPQVVAVEGDVEGADRNVDALEGVDAGGQPASERDPAGGNAEKDGAGGARGLLENLMSDAVDDPVQVGRTQNDLARRVGAWRCHGGPPSPPHGTGR